MNSVKKCIVSVLALLFVISVLSGCGSPNSPRFYTKESIIQQCSFEDAERAYKETEDWFKEKDFISGTNYRCGWLKNCYDCDIYECYYIAGNLIISTEMEYRSNYFEEGDETLSTSATRKINRDDLIKFLEKEFPAREW